MISLDVLEMMLGHNAAMTGQPFDETRSAEWQEGWHIGQQHSHAIDIEDRRFQRQMEG